MTTTDTTRFTLMHHDKLESLGSFELYATEAEAVQAAVDWCDLDPDAYPDDEQGLTFTRRPAGLPKHGLRVVQVAGSRELDQALLTGLQAAWDTRGARNPMANAGEPW